MTTTDGAVLGSTQIYGSAALDHAFNVVLLADGFTAAQQGDFDTACTDFTDKLLATAPLAEVKSAINVFRVNVASTDSGADDPAGDGGMGTTSRTYFDSSFGGRGIRRLLQCNGAVALQVAATRVAARNLAVLVVVNSPIYGGSGGSVGTFSLDSRASQIGVHEMGHTAFNLADEYAYLTGGTEPGQNRHPGPEPRRPNVTITANRAGLKWGWAVAATTAVPTMTNPNCAISDPAASTVAAGTVGLFEGADTYHCGAYRPEFDCYMRTLGTPFCAVCRQVITDRIGPLQVPMGQLRRVFSGGDGVIYAIAENGDLLWYRHDGRGDGSFTWAEGSPKKVGAGWGGLRAVFSGGNGVIYGVNDAGDLLWYRHDGRFDGSFTWAEGSPKKVGVGWGGLPTLFAGG